MKGRRARLRPVPIPPETLERLAALDARCDWSIRRGERRGTAYWPLHDASGDIAAVCVPGVTGQAYARVAAQLRYDAYGQVLSADYLHPHAFLAAGHKGLFFDRLDRGVADPLAPGTVPPPGGLTTETPRLVPFARGVYHVRNRSMLPGGGSPTLIGAESLVCANPPACSSWTLSQQGLGSGAAVHGRFMQADPNATAMVLMSDLAIHGRPMAPSVAFFDLDQRTADGASFYTYLGSNPWKQSDPFGTFIFGVDDLVMLGFGALKGGVGSMIEQYAANMESDIDWALGWDQGDDWHSRTDSSWVAISFEAGLVSGFNEALEDMFYIDELEGLSDLVFAQAGFAGKAGRGAKAMRRFNMIRGELPGFVKTWVKHGSDQAERLMLGAKYKPQGWFTNRVQTERFLSKLDMSKGSRTVALPPGMGKVAMPDGRVVVATKVRIQTTVTGAGKPRLDHAYPMP